MAVVKRMCPDGKGGFIELYSAPLTTRDANAWLDRIGNKRIRFYTAKNQAYLKDAVTNQILASCHTVYELCYFITSSNSLKMKFGVTVCDWYRAPNVFQIRFVETDRNGVSTIEMKSQMSWTIVYLTHAGASFGNM